MARREGEKSSLKCAIWWWRGLGHYSRSSSKNLISNSIFSHIFLMVLLGLILHAEYDHISLCSPLTNSWPKLLFPILCFGCSLFSPRILTSHSILKFCFLISFSETKNNQCAVDAKSLGTQRMAWWCLCFFAINKFIIKTKTNFFYDQVLSC